MSSEPVIAVNEVSKAYHIYAHPRDRLKQALLPRLQRTFGRLMPGGESHRAAPRSYYREFWALKGVTFSVAAGESVGIVGGNGAGKSTLLQIIAGTLAQTKGDTKVKGRVAALLELGSGFNPEFTGRENVLLNASILGLTVDEIEAKKDDILAFADIGSFVDQPVKTYSSGMLVRLAFAVQAHVDPEVLIVDEALSVGDVRFTLKCVRRLRELRERGTSVLFVSHDLSSVVNFCDRAIWMAEGEIRMIGDPKSVTLAYYNHMTYGDSSAAALVPPVSVDANPAPEIAPPSDGTNPEDAAWQELSGEGGFATGSLVATRIALIDRRNAQAVAIVEGGEPIRLTIEFRCEVAVESPVVAAHLYDRKGNLIFGLNSCFLKSPLSRFHVGLNRVKFEFEMPVLQVGDYAWSLGVANGSYDQSESLLVLNDAAILRVHPRQLSQNHFLISLNGVVCHQE